MFQRVSRRTGGTQKGVTLAWNMHLTGLDAVEGRFAATKERVPACVAVSVVFYCIFSKNKTMLFIP